MQESDWFFDGIRLVPGSFRPTPLEILQIRALARFCRRFGLPKPMLWKRVHSDCWSFEVAPGRWLPPGGIALLCLFDRIVADETERWTKWKEQRPWLEPAEDALVATRP